MALSLSVLASRSNLSKVAFTFFICLFNWDSAQLPAIPELVKANLKTS